MSITVDDCKNWAKITGDDNDALVGVVLAAVVDHLATKYDVPAEYPDAVALAVRIQVARWWKRRDAPGGTVEVGPDGAVVRVGFDPDLTDILGPYRRYAIG